MYVCIANNYNELYERSNSAIEKAGLRERVKIMVGGAPLNDAFAKSIGADAYTSNANAAVVVAKELLSKE